MTKNILLTALTILLSGSAFSQESTKKIWLSGNSRGIFNHDEITGENLENSVKKYQYGHTLLDLSANIQTNKNTFIRSTFRVRNEYGGFWGSAITFDLRELYLKGLIANSVRYQIGDIDYKLSPFTFYNNSEDIYENSLDIFNLYSDILHHDLFYSGNNTWRQQGLAADFSLSFREGIEELQFNMFSSRVNPAGGGQDDRILFGGNVTMVQSNAFTAGLNYINLYDIDGTSNSTTNYRNPVLTANYELREDFEDFSVELSGEAGTSKSINKRDSLETLELEDYFSYSKLTAKYKPFDLELSIAYRNVGPEFRSAGAQTRRLINKAQNGYFNQYSGGERPTGIWDIYNNASLYNTSGADLMYRMQVEEDLSNYYPQYNNIDPYGLATPNRKGFDVTLSRTDDQKRYSVTVDLGMLKEINGEEIEKKDIIKEYNSISAYTDINVNEFIAGFDRKLLVQLGYTQDHTLNNAESESTKSDLKSERITAGLTLGLSEELDFMAGYELFTAVGVDHVLDRNGTELSTSFARYETDLTENILGLGFKYKFNDKNDLQILWQDYTWSNTNYHSLETVQYDPFMIYQKEEKPDYGFQRISVAFTMKF